MSVLDQIRAMAATAFDVELFHVSAESTWSELGADAGDIISLLIEVEEDYGVSFDHCQHGMVDTVGRLAAFVEANKTREPA